MFFIYMFFQVFDLGEEAPDKVLHRLYANLEKLKSSGDDLATEIQNNLRLIVSQDERRYYSDAISHPSDYCIILHC